MTDDRQRGDTSGNGANGGHGANDGHRGETSRSRLTRARDAGRSGALAEAISRFQDEVVAGGSPDPNDLLERFPGDRDELELVLSLLACGADILSPGAPGAPGDDATDHALAPGTVLGEYRILREIGRGGMGVVYAAEQVALSRPVALKVLPRSLGIDASRLERFQREARVAAGLHHTNVLPVYDFGLDQGVAYYSMELVDGPSLDRVLDELRRRGSPPATRAHIALLDRHTSPQEDDGERDAAVDANDANLRSRRARARRDSRKATAIAYARKVAQLLSGVAEALHRAHQKGIVHRDVKPANLMLAGGELTIADFGIASMAGERTATGKPLGTPHYMSPEQARSAARSVDHRTDIYSLGVTLYELLALRRPFTGRDTVEVLRRIQHDEPPTPRRWNPWVPRDLVAVTVRAMEKSPDRRYASALELSNDLRRFVLGKPVIARRPGIVRRTARRLAASWKRWTIAGLLLGLGAAAFWSHAAAERERAHARATRSARLVEMATDLLSGQFVNPAELPAGVPAIDARPRQALACLEEALALTPQDPAGRRGIIHYLRGNAHFELAELEETVAAFTRSIELGAEPGASYYRRGMALEALGRTAEGLRDRATAEEIAPDDGLLIFHQAANAEAEGRTAEAIELFHRALAARPELRAQAFYRLGRCHYERGDRERALACLRVASGLRPLWEAPLALLGRIGHETSNTALVGEVLAGLKRMAPESQEAQRILLHCLGRAREFAEAKRLGAEWGRPSDWWKHSHLALAEAGWSGDAALIEERITSHLAQSPRCYLARSWLGALRNAQGRLEEARDAYLEADRVDPSSGTGHVLAAGILVRLERFAEAEELLLRALEVKQEVLAKGAGFTMGRNEEIAEIPRSIVLGPGDRPPVERAAQSGVRLDPVLSLGTLYRRIGRLEDSRTYLERAVRERPFVAAARYELAWTLFVLDEKEAARRELEESVRLGAEDVQAFIMLAMASADTGRTERAFEALAEARRLFPHAELRSFEASLAQRAGRFDVALRGCDEALAAAVPHAEIYHHIRGQALEALGREREAEEAFAEVTRIAPRWSHGHWQLGRRALQRGDPARAESHLRRARDLISEGESSPPIGTLFVPTLDLRQATGHLAESVLAQGRVAEARALAATFHAVEPRSGKAHAWVALAYDHLGRTPDGIRYASHALRALPDDLHIMFALAKLHAGAGELRPAVNWLRRFLEREPWFVEAHTLLASVLEKHHSAAAGEAALERALRQFADDAGRRALVQHQLGHLLLRDGREKEAAAVFRELLDEPAVRKPSHIRNDLAWALLNDPDAGEDARREALELAHTLAEETPDDAHALKTCGLASLRAGDAASAHDFFSRAESLFAMEIPAERTEHATRRGDTLVLLSIAAARLERRDEARGALERGLTLAGESRFAAEARAALATPAAPPERTPR